MNNRIFYITKDEVQEAKQNVNKNVFLQKFLGVKLRQKRIMCKQWLMLLYFHTFYLK